MKKTKISALLVTAAMLIQSMPMIMAAEETTIPNELDFENVEAGTELSSMEGVVVNYGSPTVEKDEKGSMAVKINSPLELRFKLVGDKRYTSIEYKYRVESHTANNNLYEFGSILNGENRMLKSVINGSKLISYFAQENATVSNMSQNDQYITMKYIVDKQTKATEIYVNGFKKSNYKGTTFGYFNDTDGAPDTLLFNPRIDGIEYYIDDIKWETSDELITESEPVSSVRTFSNDSDLDGVTFTNDSNKEIVTEDDGNKALKITGANGVKFAVPSETTSEKVEVSFDMKAENLTNFNGYLDPCFDVRNGNTSAVHTNRRWQGMLAFYGTSNQWVKNHINSTDNTLFADTASGKYAKIKYVIDTKKQSYKLYVDGTAKEHSGNYDWGYYNTGISAVDNLYLNFPSGDVVYIDNVTIKDIIPPTEWNFENDSDVAQINGLTVSGTNEITDDNGNKVLKATGANTITFSAKTTASNIAEVSYKIRIESLSANGNLQDFGCVRNGSQEAIHSVHYKGNILQYYGQDAAKNGKLFETIDNTKYYTVKHVIDFKNQKYTTYVDGNIWKSDIILRTDDVKAVNTLYFNSIADNVIYLDDVSIKEIPVELTESVPSNGAVDTELDTPIRLTFNQPISDELVNTEYFKLYEDGTEMTGYTVSQSTDGVIEFTPSDKLNYKKTYTVKALKGVGAKDITVTFKTLENFKETVEYNYDFSEYTDGDIPVMSNGLGWAVSGANIATDTETSNGKVLAMTCTDRASAKLTFPMINAQEIEVSYDFKAVNHSRNSLESDYGFGSVLSDNKFASKNSLYKQMYIAYGALGNKNENRGVINPLDSEWHTVTQKINLSDSTLKLSVDGGDENGLVMQNSVTGVNMLGFSLLNNSNNPSGTTGDGVYYIDNVKIKAVIYPAVAETTPSNGAKDVSVGTDVKIGFNRPVGADSLSNISIKENGNMISSDRYTITAESETSAKISINNMLYGADYEITVENIRAAQSELIMQYPYTLSFKTVPEYEVKDITVSNGTTDDTMEVSAVVVNNAADGGKDYKAYAAVYDTEGMLRGIKSQSGNVEPDGADYIKISMNKPANWMNDWTVKVFVWDELEALADKHETEIPQKRTYGFDTYIDSTKPLTAAFLGGSITEQTFYSNPLVEQFGWNGRDDVTYINAGVGGTTSYLGMYRLEKDIISKNPDVVFLEYAVNDYENNQSEYTMENIIRRLMKLEHQPVIILLYMPTAASANEGESAVINKFEQLADYYGIGSVNVRDYINQGVNDGKYTWDSDKASDSVTLLSTDKVHPTKAGGQIYADYILSMLNGSSENYFKKMNEQEKALFDGVDFKNPVLVSHTAGTYSGKWYESSTCSNRLNEKSSMTDTAGSSVTYTFTGTSIGLYLAKGPNGGTASYSIDNGAATGTINSYLALTMPQFESLATGLEYGRHTLTVTVNEGARTNFSIGYFCED